MSIAFLALLGVIAAKVGDAPMGRSVARITFWGSLAMGVTAGVGKLLGTVL